VDGLASPYTGLQLVTVVGGLKIHIFTANIPTFHS
jgi:hypothetical protein